MTLLAGEGREPYTWSVLRRVSLQSRLLVVTLPLTVGVVAAIALSTYLVARRVVLEQLERDVVRTSQIAATEARAAFEQAKSDVATVAESPLFRDHFINVEYGLTQEAEVYRREIEKMLAAFAGRTGTYTRLAYADSRGRILAEVDRAGIVKPAGRLDGDLLERAAGLEHGKILASTARTRSDGGRSITFAAALGSLDRGSRAYLAAEYSLDRIESLLARLAIGQSGRSVLSPREAEGAAALGVSRGAGDRVVARADVPGSPWAVVTSVERDEFLDPLSMIGAWTALLGLLACALISLAVAAQVRASVGPIRALADAASTLASGNLKARVVQDGAREVSILAEAFNSMADRLERRTGDLVMRVRELTAVHKLNETALRNLGRHAVARACLDAAVAGLGARRGALYRVDSGNLVLEAGGSGERPEPPGRRQAVSRSPSAVKALATGEAVDAGRDAALIPGAKGEVVCAPLSTRGRASHLLCLDLPEAGPERVRSFSLFCGAAGMALENADLLETTVASESRYRTAIENSPHAVVSLDQTFRVTLWNRRAEALFGWQPSEAYGRTLDFVLEPAEYKRILRQVEVEGAVRELPAHAAARDGRRLAVTVSWTGQAPSERGVREWFVVIQDETEKRRLQAQLIHAEKLSAVGTLVAGVAHELNNPLAAVVGFAEILQELPANARQRDDLKHLYASALRCRDIVRGLLSFVRRSPPRLVRVDLNAVVEKTLELVEYRLVRTEGVTLDVERSAGELPVPADPGRLEQVIVNLLSNASDALRAWPRERRIRILTRPGARGPRLEVEDTGPGVPPEHRDSLFEPFFTTKPLGVGTGLGLAISSQIVAEFGGTLSYEPGPDGGARFVASFPPCGDVPEAPGEAVETAAPRSRDRRILVVDDEAPVLALMQRLLSEEGSVSAARDFETARSLIAGGRFDLVVLDADLGARKGWDLLEFLPSPGPALVIVSGDVLNAELSERFSGLEIPVLAKPFLRSEFLRAVRQAFQLIR